jgi:hypothetical protein
MNNKETEFADRKERLRSISDRREKQRNRKEGWQWKTAESRGSQRDVVYIG